MPHLENIVKGAFDIIVREYTERDRPILRKMISSLRDHIVSVEPRDIEAKNEGYADFGLNWTLGDVSRKNGKIYLAENEKREVIRIFLR